MPLLHAPRATTPVDPTDPTLDDAPDDDTIDEPLAPLPDLDGDGEDGADEPVSLPDDATPASLDDEAAGDAFVPVVLQVWSDEGSDEDGSIVAPDVDLGWIDDGTTADDLEPAGGFDEPLGELPDPHADDDLDGPLAPDEPLPDEAPGDEDDDAPAGHPTAPPRPLVVM